MLYLFLFICPACDLRPFSNAVLVLVHLPCPLTQKVRPLNAVLVLALHCLTILVPASRICSLTHLAVRICSFTALPFLVRWAGYVHLLPYRSWSGGPDMFSYCLTIVVLVQVGRICSLTALLFLFRWAGYVLLRTAAQFVHGVFSASGLARLVQTEKLQAQIQVSPLSFFSRLVNALPMH